MMNIGFSAAKDLIKSVGRISHIASYHIDWHVLPRRTSCKERRRMRRIAGAWGKGLKTTWPARRSGIQLHGLGIHGIGLVGEPAKFERENRGSMGQTRLGP